MTRITADTCARFYLAFAALLPVVFFSFGPAQAEEEEPQVDDDTRSCINTRGIRRVRALDEKNVLFYFSNRTIFHNTLEQACSEIRQYGQIAYSSTTGHLCRGDNLSVLRSGPSNGMHLLPNCRLGKFRKLSADEVQIVRDVERGRIQPAQPAQPDRVEIGVVKDDPEVPES